MLRRYLQQAVVKRNPKDDGDKNTWRSTADDAVLTAAV